ncbi:unnamed protein product [Cyprideis torosa]|uniref:Uncharacterized protein n=1 Tax=Cyprideis torosa TaxID=163714 RepID=A0A7R8W0K9_9CRUS|nr:unnamed protein product [Cyprideis torosa]CAG0879868.1 unnamed protein product [Cyprideis torosa]
MKMNLLPQHKRETNGLGFTPFNKIKKKRRIMSTLSVGVDIEWLFPPVSPWSIRLHSLRVNNREKTLTGGSHNLPFIDDLFCLQKRHLELRDLLSAADTRQKNK